jgi:hypothetical protein
VGRQLTKLYRASIYRHKSFRLVRLQLHITPRRGLDGGIVSVALRLWRGHGSVGMASYPRIPIRPPTSGFLFGGVEPALRIGLEVVVKPATALVAGRRIDDTGDVPARGKDKSSFTSDQILRPKCRLPWHDVIIAGREEIDRYVNLAEIHPNPALRGLSGILDVVFKIGVACVPAVYRAGQADAVGIPMQ